jgi:transposase
MYSYEERIRAVELYIKLGKRLRATIRQLGIARNTVRSYLRDLARTPAYGPRAARSSKLDPFKPYLRDRIEADKPYWIPVTVLYREITTQGFDGKEGMFKNYLHQFKPNTEEEVVRFETPPGQQMQVDFTTIRRGHWRRARIRLFDSPCIGFSTVRPTPQKTLWAAREAFR